MKYPFAFDEQQDYTDLTTNYMINFAAMKMFYENNYKRIITTSWAVLLLLIWMQYIYLSTLLEATLMLLVFAPAICISHILTNIWLPKAVQRKKLVFFIFQFIGIIILTAFIMAVSCQCIIWAGTKQYISDSVILASSKSLLIEFLFLIPSVLVINFGFCGLRFLYEHIKLQRIHLETQLQVLQSQINPHFMFNILNHIHILIQTNVDLASSLLLQYSDVLRYQLYNVKNESVKLEQEVQFLKNFIEIEKVRWGDKIDVSCTWEIEDVRKEIPPLLFITFVENAFKHVSRSSSEQNYIKTNFVQKGNMIYLDIENSKSDIPIKSSGSGSGLGLENIKKRLDILYHNDYKLVIKDMYPVYHSKLEIWQK